MVHNKLEKIIEPTLLQTILQVNWAGKLKQARLLCNIRSQQRNDLLRQRVADRTPYIAYNFHKKSSTKDGALLFHSSL